MNLYPAIDLKEGKCIRLKKGELKKLLFITQTLLINKTVFLSMGLNVFTW